MRRDRETGNSRVSLSSAGRERDGMLLYSLGECPLAIENPRYWTLPEVRPSDTPNTSHTRY